MSEKSNYLSLSKQSTLLNITSPRNTKWPAQKCVKAINDTVGKPHVRSDDLLTVSVKVG